ncbi:MAG: hypothetical protein LBK95_10760 [Bifidobacteriaceae bacterium]|jgi:multidrug efflux pump subunit AcrA (membrane-fusion protein)|nr:hypothetical protein [Bifidobacteriaceae bacterium]
MTKKGWITASAIAGVLVIGAGAATWWGVARSRDNDEDTKKVRTATVERTSLASGVEIMGTLEYGTAEELAGATGIVTKVPEAGSTHQAGEPLLEIEGNPVFLLHGAIPLWRDLGAGMSGIDVDTLRAALVELGYSAGNTAAATPYDAALAGAIDAMYAKGGYPAPSTRPDSIKARDEANQELAAAREALAAAEQALRQARQGPGKKDLTDANNAIAAAKRALSAAQGCTAQQRADSPEPGGPCDVAAAREALDSAEAGKADLTAPMDASAESAAVASAQTSLTAAQLKADQAALSTVGSKDILLIPTTEMRVDQIKAKIGQSAEGPVVTWTSTTLAATADLTDSQRKLLVSGAAVEVALPDGTIVAGLVADISAARQDQNTGEMLPARARIDIEDQATLAGNGVSGVTITMIEEEAEGALVVPVTALLALSEGGYAVELPNGTLIGVEVGLIQDTRAQIIPTTGDLEEGDEVVIA